jgi:hypothetical protein
MKRTYRLIEVEDKWTNDGKPFWKVQKCNIFGYWTDYFEEHSENGATYYNKEEAENWYNYHIDKRSKVKLKVLAQKTI